MYNGVGPAAAANKFEFSCLDMRSPRMLINSLRSKTKNLDIKDPGEPETLHKEALGHALVLGISCPNLRNNKIDMHN